MGPPTLLLRWHAFHTQKRGNAPEEYEDAFAGDLAKGRFAVADGASECSFAAEWAKLLAEGFVRAAGKPWHDLDWLAAARRDWSRDVDGRPLPWYAEEKREQGAYATLVGFACRPRRSLADVLKWRALAVGDSCLFRLRAGQLRQAFPLTRAEEFGNLPSLLGSRGKPADTPSAVHRRSGLWLPGDRFLLTTDALAEWLLRRSAHGQHPAADIDRLLAESAPRKAFAGWIEERRSKQQLRNDDVTLLVLDLKAPG